MDFDLFFSSPRWKILEILAESPSSPVEISKKLNTTVSYISQQLKLLEAGSIVVKQRTGSAEKGKPRMIYSLSKEVLQINVLMNNLSARKIIYLDEYHKIILRIWSLENQELHYSIEKLFWKIEDYISDIDGIFIDVSLKKPKILIVSDSKKLPTKISSSLKDMGNIVDCSQITANELIKYPRENIHAIHNPNFLLEKNSEKNNTELKGGINE